MHPLARFAGLPPEGGSKFLVSPIGVAANMIWRSKATLKSS